MNDFNFEDSLRALLPSSPPAGIEERIASELSTREAVSAASELAAAKRQPVSIRFEQAREPLLVRCFHSLGWAVAGAASAVAAIAIYPAKPAPEKATTVMSSGYKPTVAPANSPTLAGLDLRQVRTPGTDGAVPSPAESPDPADLSPASLPLAAKVVTVSGDSDDFQALETTRELVSTEEGNQVVYQSDNSPMRQVRYVYRERHAWTNPRTGARVEIEVPREDVFLKPVSLQ